jgi:hypothetical protein
LIIKLTIHQFFDKWKQEQNGKREVNSGGLAHDLGQLLGAVTHHMLAEDTLVDNLT